ncbi:unnamed protein product, partial [Prorocentrum cordatum]
RRAERRARAENGARRGATPSPHSPPPPRPHCHPGERRASAPADRAGPWRTLAPRAPEASTRSGPRRACRCPSSTPSPESQKAEVREKEEELARARRETPSFMELLPSTFIDRSDMRQKEEALRRVQDGEATYSVLLPVAVLAGAAVVAPPIFTNVGAWLSLFR